MSRLRHPSWRELNRLADDELDNGPRRMALEHVAGCPRCARRMSFLTSLREAGREMRHPSPPKDLLDDILRSRNEGGRVILPASPPPARSRLKLPAAAAGIALAGLAGLATILLVSEAGAGASELWFDPPDPVPGEQVRVTYRPGNLLADESSLRLRVRFRAPDSEPPRGTLGTHHDIVLMPDGDGGYTGTLQLPRDFAFAMSVVEDMDGDRVDDRAGRLWSLRAHMVDGLPSLGALRQEFLVLQSSDWPAAGRAIAEMYTLYPDHAEGWSLQLAHDDVTALPDEAAADLAKHREIFRKLNTQLLSARPDVDEAAGMVRYATALGDDDVLQYWSKRLESQDPHHRFIVSRRVAALAADPEQAESYLESLWSAEGLRTEMVYRRGFQFAGQAGDAEAVRRWALRGLALADDHIWTRNAALALVAYPETRARGLAEIRRLLAHLDEESIVERPLHSRREDVRLDSRRLGRDLHALLGEELLAIGEVRAAIAELNAAEGLGGWNPKLYRVRFEARLLEGDTLAALADFHRLDADPIYSRQSVDSLYRRIPARSPGELAAGRAKADRELAERLLAEQSIPRPLPEAELLTATGASRSLDELLARRPTVLVFWDRRVFESDVEELVRAGDLLSGGSGQLVWVTSEPSSRSLLAFKRASNLELPSYHDPDSNLATALGEWRLRAYYVIDRAGSIRARVHSLMEAVRHVEVLELESRDTA